MLHEGLHNYLDNLDGNTRRIKFRIRWYGKLFEEIKGTINCLHIPHFETLPYDFFSPSKRIINQRLTAFAQLKNNSSLFII